MLLNNTKLQTPVASGYLPFIILFFKINKILAVNRGFWVCVMLQNQLCLLLFSEYKQIKEVMFWQRRIVCLFVCG